MFVRSLGLATCGLLAACGEDLGEAIIDTSDTASQTELAVNDTPQVTTGGDTIQIGGLLQAVIQGHAAAELEDGEPLTVSVTLDVSAAAAPGEEVVFQSRIDRRTRTLIFASGIAAQAGNHLLKATVVFRIA